MTTLALVLFFFQLVVAVMALLNFVMALSSALADRDMETAKYHLLWGFIEGGVSILTGLVALGLLK